MASSAPLFLKLYQTTTVASLLASRRYDGCNVQVNLCYDKMASGEVVAMLFSGLHATIRPEALGFSALICFNVAAISNWVVLF